MSDRVYNPEDRFSHDEAQFCFSLEEKADLLNRYFTSISTVNDDNASLPAFEYKCQNRLSRIVCTSMKSKFSLVY